MVEVVCFRGRQEWEVVATVWDSGGSQGYAEPQPSCSDVRPHQDGTHHGRQQVTDHMLYRVSIHPNDPDRGCPLMMDLVDVFIEAPMVQQSEITQSLLVFWQSTAWKYSYNMYNKCIY